MSELFRSVVSGERRGVTAALLRAGLAAISVPYGFAVGLRNRLYDRGWRNVHRAAVPVVSIGNLTLGGTGKTPAVEYVAGFYHPAGRRVAILSRGYGGRGGHNDEALLLSENLPHVLHLQGADRVALACRAVEEFDCEILLLDDGFQHRRLHRDLDIVLIDATDAWGGGRLFPRGMLREPKASLRRAHLALLTRCDQVCEEVLASLRTEIDYLAPGIPIVESIHAPQALMNSYRVKARCVLASVAHGLGSIATDAGQRTAEASVELLKGSNVAAFCGIGNPQAFQRTLQQLGANVVTLEVFPDHHHYTQSDIDRLGRWVRRQPAEVVVTTQKDLVKLRLAQLGGRPMWALRIALQPTAGQEVLDRMLKGVLQ